MNPEQAAKNALQGVLEAKQNERLVILCDDVKSDVGKAFLKGAEKIDLNAELVIMETKPDVFRRDIPEDVLKYVNEPKPDIFLNLFRGTREETPFRIKLIHAETEDCKRRLGHCPGVTLDMLTEGALALTLQEHGEMQDLAVNLMKKLHGAIEVEVESPAGTRLTLNVEGRPFFTDTKLDWDLMKWMNLPTGEVIVAPVENSLEGKLVCDVAIGGIGLIENPVELTIEGGRVKNTSSSDQEVLGRVEDSLNTDEMARVVGEFAFGINPKARLVKEFLECEKMLGTIHLAFGDNLDMPKGKNSSANHMDFMISKPTVKVSLKDNSSITVLEDGNFQKF